MTTTEHLTLPDRQTALVADLIEVVRHDEPSVGRMLPMIFEGLREVAGLDRATIYAPTHDGAPPAVVAAIGAVMPSDHALGVAAFLAPQSAGPAGTDNRVALPLLCYGDLSGVLVLAGSRLHDLRPEVVAAVALYLGGTLRALAATRERQFVAHSAAAFWSTSPGSSRSTICTGTTRVTRCGRASPNGCGRRPATTAWWPGSAATSSPCW